MPRFVQSNVHRYQNNGVKKIKLGHKCSKRYNDGIRQIHPSKIDREKVKNRGDHEWGKSTRVTKSSHSDPFKIGKRVDRQKLLDILPEFVSSVYPSSLNLPFIQLQTAGLDFSVLLDSGASVSLLQESTYNFLKDKVKITHVARQVTLHTVTREKIHFLKCITLPFKIAGRRYRHQFFVTAQKLSHDIQILLGYDFLKDNSAIIDFRENVLKISNDLVPLNKLDVKVLHDTNIPRTNPCSSIFVMHTNEFEWSTKQAKFSNQDCRKNRQDIFYSTTELNSSGDSHVIRDNCTDERNRIHNPKSTADRTQIRTHDPVHSAKHVSANITHELKSNISTKLCSGCSEQQNNDNKTKLHGKTATKIKLNPWETKMINLKLSHHVRTQSKVWLTPLTNEKSYQICESVNTVLPNDQVSTIISNITDRKLVIHKSTKLVKFDDQILIKDFINNDQVLTDSSQDSSSAQTGHFSQRSDTEQCNAHDSSTFAKQQASNNLDLPSETCNSLQTDQKNMADINLLRKEQLKESDFDLSHLDENDKKVMLKLLMQNYQCFSKNYETLGFNNSIKPDLKLTHQYPISQKPFPLNHSMRNYLKEEIQDMLRNNIIEPSTSNYSSPLLLVKKKTRNNQPGEQQSTPYRICLDFRLLNKISEKHITPAARVQDILQRLAGKKYYSTLDLKAAFMQVELPEHIRDPFSFITDIGRFRPKRLMFGHINSSQYFSELMNMCLGPLKDDTIDFFLDDIIIASDSIQEMIVKLQAVFDRLKEFNLTLDPAKAKLLLTNATFLGYEISQNGISPSDTNITKINNCTAPKNAKQLRRFLGMAGYFRNLIPNFSQLTLPLTELTKKGIKFVWSKDCEEAFQKVQTLIFSKPVVRPPNVNKPFYLITDASKHNIAAILLNKYDQEMIPVSYFSRKLNNSERNYHASKKELLSIHDSILFFSDHLYGKKFTVLTDCKALTYHLKAEKQPEIVLRWLMNMQAYDFDTLHIPGDSNPADFFSRENYSDTVHKNFIAHILQTNESLSMRNIAQQQELDKFCQKITQKLQQADKRFSDMYIINEQHNVLMRRADSLKFQNKTQDKIVVPKSLINDVIQEAHVVHFGATKTLNFIRKKYFWHGAYSDVMNFCKRCDKCLTYKAKKTVQEPLKFFAKGTQPNDLLALDIVGKLVRSNNGYNFILTVMCLTTRHLTCIPMKNITSKSIIQQLNKYFCTFGLPKEILTDNGTNFVSNEFEEFLKLLGIGHRKTSIYFPQSNGCLESRHLLMKNSLACLCDSNFDWDTKIDYFTMYYNNSLCRVTKLAPNQLYFGRLLNLPMDLHSVEKSNFEPTLKHLKKMQENFTQMFEFSLKVQKEQFEKENAKFNAQHKGQKFQVGEEVYLRNFIHSTSLQPKSQGKFIVQRVFRNSNYLISNDEGRSLKVHSSKLIKLPEERLR